MQNSINIDQFIEELKVDLTDEWLDRFDFSQLSRDDEKSNTWYLPVKDRILQEPGTIWANYSYPEWCTIGNLKKFCQHFTENAIFEEKYIVFYECVCELVDFYDCYVSLTRGDITVKFYWVQF